MKCIKCGKPAHWKKIRGEPDPLCDRCLSAMPNASKLIDKYKWIGSD